MPILNYTTTISPEKSVADIQRVLSSHGVLRVIVEFGPDRIPAGLSFAIETQFGPRAYRLPANINGVEAVLQKQLKQGKVPRKLASREQAARVAWRILLDWVSAQLALIESGLVVVDQVFLPYMLANGNQTVYQVMVDHQLALSGPKGDKS